MSHKSFLLDHAILAYCTVSSTGSYTSQRHPTDLKLHFGKESHLSLQPPRRTHNALPPIRVHGPLADGQDVQVGVPPRRVHLHAGPGDHGGVVGAEARRGHDDAHAPVPAGCEGAAQDVHEEAVAGDASRDDER